MDTKEWMENYLSKEKGKGSILFAGIFFVVAGIFMLGVANGDVVPLITGLGALVLGGGIAYTTLNSGSETKNWIQMMEREGKLQTVLADFRDAREFLGGELKLGQYWCFGKGAKIPVVYGEILRAYQHVHKTNFVEDSRKLMVVTSGNRTVTLCELPVGGRGDQELNRVLTVMLAKNPHIQIGYQK